MTGASARRRLRAATPRIRVAKIAASRNTWQAISRILAEFDNTRQVAPKLLRAIGEGLDWDCGAFWMTATSSRALQCVATWSRSDRTAAAFGTFRHHVVGQDSGFPGRILARGAAVWLPDIARAAGLPSVSGGTNEGLHGAFGFPVRHGHEVLGVVEFRSRRARRADRDQIELMTAAGSQIGLFLALERARGVNAGLESEVVHGRHRERYMRLLEDATIEFGAQHALPALFNAIARRCAEALGEWCVLAWIDPGHPSLVVETLYHPDPARGDQLLAALRSSPIPKDGPLVSRIVGANGPVVLSPDIPQDRGERHSVPAISETFAGLGITAVLMVPFSAGGARKGLFAIGAEGARQWNEDEMRFASVIAERMGSAIRNAQLIESERSARAVAEREASRANALLKLRRRMHDEEKALSAIAAAIAGETDLTRVLALVLGPLQPMLRFTGGSIVLLEGDELIVSAAVGPQAGEVVGRRVPHGQGPIGRVVDTGQPFTGEVLGAAAMPWAQPVHSCLAAPLSWRGRTFGALEVHTLGAPPLEPGMLPLMQRVAAMLSGSVELTRRYAAEVQATADAEAARRAEQRARRLAEQAVNRTARLQAITAALSRAITPSQVGDVIVDQGVRALEAKAGLMALLTEDGAALQVVRDEGFPESLVDGWRSIPMSTSTALTEAVRTGELIFLDSEDTVMEGSPHVPGVHALLQAGARAVVPLTFGERMLGVLAFNFSHRREVPEEDRAFLRSLSQQCAQALDRARLYEREHRVAETLQRAFLPAGLPDIPGVTIHAAYIPGAADSEIGGDWYDVFRLPDGRVALSIGDVVGRGLLAATIMGQVRQSIRAAALDSYSPHVVLDSAGRVLHLTYEAEGMATAVFGILDPVSLTFTYSTAGHPAPLLVSPDGRVEELPCGGLPLGVQIPAIPPAWIVPVPRGSLLVLYTDGLIEATRNVMEGEVALKAAVFAEAQNPAPDPAMSILARTIPGAPADDVAILTIGISTVTRTRFDLSMRATPAAGQTVRPALRQFLAESGVGRDVESDLQIAVGEALNNVIEHAYGAVPGMVHISAWREGPALFVEVRDDGRWRLERQEDRGHGLSIMRGLVDAVDVSATASGTTVRLSLEMSPSAIRAP